MIDSFKGKYHFLSNFHPCTVTIKGIEYPSVEHAYMAHKAPEDKDWQALCQNKTIHPSIIKRFSRNVQLVDQWGTQRLIVMIECIRAKFFQNKYLAEALLDTGDEQLVEGNTWGDTFWGVCDGKGDNYLGKILMETRKELKERPK